MNDKVIIRCPRGTDQKYPAFFRAFDGQRARVVGDVTIAGGVFAEAIQYQHPEKQVSKWVRVDIGTRESQVHITVDRRWLSRMEGL